MLPDRFEFNRQLILVFYQCFDDRQMDRAVELLASDFVAHLAGVSEPLDRAGFRDFGMSFYSAFSGGKHQFDEVIVTEDRVVTCGTFFATHVGEFQGLPPTGKQIKLAVMHIDRIENGKIIEHWGQGDVLGLMQQLGIVFLPGLKLFPSIIKVGVTKIFTSSATH